VDALFQQLGGDDPVREGAWSPRRCRRDTLEVDDNVLMATTQVSGDPIIRTKAWVAIGAPLRATGQLRYLTRAEGALMSGRYPFVADLAETSQVQEIEFLDPGHPVASLRPAEPLRVTFGFYSPWISFCYPGGEGPLGSRHGS